MTGVLPAEFTGLGRGVVNDIWVSTDGWFGVLGNREERLPQVHVFEMVARLKPGVTPERAAAQLDAAIRGQGKWKPAPSGAPGTSLDARVAPDWQSSLIKGGGLTALRNE